MTSEIQQDQVAGGSCTGTRRGRLFGSAAGRFGGVLILVASLTLGGWPGQSAAETVADLTDMSLEALMDIEVTSVSKRPEKRFDAAAAIFVITRDDIRRWGVTNIPDALRMVPGLHVARIDANKWAITSRGFNSRFANKLLVLMDGRSVYTPLFAGVYWDALETPLDDIERIEVIRGPGGTLWGANAVNGVINIITRNSSETRGTLLSGGAGTETQGLVTLRHGARTRGGIDYRVYAHYRAQDAGFNSAGAHDSGDIRQLGFRMDWAGEDRDRFTLQGDLQRGTSSQQVTVPADPPPAAQTLTDDAGFGGGNVLFRWRRTLDTGSDFSLQFYYDHVDRDGAVLTEDRDTVDVDFNYHLRWRERHDLLWGLGYRNITDDTAATPTFSLVPAQRSVNLYSAFLQDEITLLEDQLLFTVGSKFEHNDFTGFEVQPNVRLAWTPGEQQTIWAAISRAVRTPARGEHDVRLRVLPPQPLPFPVTVLGSDEFRSEDLTAYELGWRLRSGGRWSLDLATFYNDYRQLRTFDPTVPPPPELGLPFANDLEGHTWGLEWSGRWQLMPAWRLQAAYTYFRASLDLRNGSTDQFSQSAEASTPRHQASLWSSTDLGARWRLDAVLRYVGHVEAPAPGAGNYAELDLSLGWRPSGRIELSLSGRNLLDRHHTEFQPDFVATQPTDVERSVFAQLRWEIGR